MYFYIYMYIYIVLYSANSHNIYFTQEIAKEQHLDILALRKLKK